MQDRSKKYYMYEDEDDCFIVQFEDKNEDDNKTFKGVVAAVIYGDCYEVGHSDDDWGYDHFTEYKFPTPIEQKEHEPNKSHKHRDLIIAWANGEEIECYNEIRKEWCSVADPRWSIFSQYRIKPVATTIERYMFIEAEPILDNAYNKPNVKFVFDIETKKLLSAEIINEE